jgi:hypothetical protein
METSDARIFWEWLRKEYPLLNRRIMGMDSISENRLAEVHPLLAQKVRAMADALVAQEPSVVIRVTQGMRTWDEQADLYAKGRTVPPIGEQFTVTNAPPGHSYHEFGLAVDVVPIGPLGPDWNVEHPVWQKIVQAGIREGLASGALWHDRKDWPHFQLTGTLPVSPTPQIRSLLQTGGVEAVWQATGLELA